MFPLAGLGLGASQLQPKGQINGLKTLKRAHPFACEMLECGDVVIGQQLGEQVERKDGVEFFARRRIASSPIVTGQFPFATRRFCLAS
ncbi:hypothetical protein I7G55_33050 [Sinorhizobium meliloti]|nr:hypothetical protein [Sinorhizobium meliloti]MDE3878770.1 hypothetical protein [Sinorhizobium meliloti]MDE4604546.1 hypothetical protein [Sinorhizobium meliloti]UDU21108.1 hypothetical protein LJD24_18175 [Sinorhizobium meliloti]